MTNSDQNNQDLVAWLRAARQEADALKATDVEPVHLLLALVVQEHPVACDLLEVWSLDREQLRRLARQLHPVDKDAAGEKPVLSLDGRQVVWAAEQRAHRADREVVLDDMLYVLMGRYWPLAPLWKQLKVKWPQTERTLLQHSMIPHTGEVFRDLNGMFDDEVLSNSLRRMGLI